jgi:hypothetical protein
MFWSTPKIPLNEEDQKWVDGSLNWLLGQFGAEYFLGRKIILPEASFFPEKYSGTESCAEALVRRVCSYMDVDASSIRVEFFSDRDEIAENHRLGGSEHSGAAGLYSADSDRRQRVAINVSQLKNPTSLVATIAHELGHVILLGGGRISREYKDHELLTDLITVFLGLGIFTANSAFQFKQWRDHSHQGWSASRQGYMTEEMFGYSLAACAWIRGEEKPAWAKHLAMNVGHYFKESLKCLNNGAPTALRKVRGPERR